MELIAIYLLKSACVLSLFLVCYQLFLRKETLFATNRWYLFSGSVLALFFPLLTYTRTVYLSGDLSVTAVADSSLTATNSEPSLPWATMLFGVYLVVTLVLTIKLFFELRTVYRYIKKGRRTVKKGYEYVESTAPIKPFSFFRYIIYNPDHYSTEDLKLILAHEEVHARQGHSMDILWIEFVLLTQWFNPFAWGYKKALKQNLEFLADTRNSVVQKHKKQYQYLLLKQSVPTGHLSIINPFFNSLIKKRIVMINQLPSRKISAFKTLFIVPLLALFFFSFNVDTTYKLADSHGHSPIGESVEMVIDKNTSETELEQMKKDLMKDHIQFDYTVRHNDKDEIVDLSIQVSGKGHNGASFNNSYNSSGDGEAISPLVIFIDREHNLVSIGSKSAYRSNIMHIDSDDGQVWISTDDDHHKDIRIKKKNGKKMIMVDGEEISEEEFDKMDLTTKGGSSRVFIHTDSDDAHDIRVIGKEGNGFFFIDTDGDAEPVYLIDGKETTSKKVRQLDPDTIESIDVSKGERAEERFGERGKNGVVEITTKKN